MNDGQPSVALNSRANRVSYSPVFHQISHRYLFSDAWRARQAKNAAAACSRSPALLGRALRGLLLSSTPCWCRKGSNWPLSSATTPSPKPCVLLRISRRSRRPIRLLRSMIVGPRAWMPERQHQRPRQVPWRPFTAASAVPRLVRSLRTIAGWAPPRNKQPVSTRNEYPYEYTQAGDCAVSKRSSKRKRR